MLDCAIDCDFRGNPVIKVTKDAPKVTLDVYTDDINYLTGLVDKRLVLMEEKQYLKLVKEASSSDNTEK